MMRASHQWRGSDPRGNNPVHDATVEIILHFGDRDGVPMKTTRAVIGALCAALVFADGPVVASPPTGANSTLPAGIQMVGMSPSGVDPKGDALVIVRDDGNDPTPNAYVEILFGSCCTDPVPDLRYAPTQPFPGMGWSFTPLGPVASVFTDEHGHALFRIVGGAAAVPGNNPGISTACATVRSDGRVLGTLRVGAYDLNSSGGVNAADQSLFLGTLFASPSGYRTRADYNGDGLVNSADLAKILSVEFHAGSIQSGAAMVCP